MKQLPSILVLLSLSFPSFCGTMDDLVEREGLYYKKFTDVPFIGQVEENLRITKEHSEKAFREVRYCMEIHPRQ